MGFEQTAQTDFHEITPPISLFFRQAAAPLTRHIADLRAAQDRAAFALADDTVGQDMAAMYGDLRALEAAEAELAALKLGLQRKLLPRQMARFEEETALLSDDEVPWLGRRFLERMREADCALDIDPDIKDPTTAIYTSYSYAPDGRGFRNRIDLNASRITENANRFSSSLRHEFFHAFQKHAAPALHFSPFNPDTRILVHPVDWIRLEILCEADAYTRQALFNMLEARLNPDVREETARDVVSVADLEHRRAMAATMEDALRDMAAQALSKPQMRGNDGWLFEDVYHAAALKNYTAAMAVRAFEKESGHTFVRLEPADFHRVGAYDVGPNVLGRDEIDPRLMTMPLLRGRNGDALEELCARRSIPPLEQCLTLRETVMAAQSVVVFHQMAAAAPMQPQMG